MKYTNVILATFIDRPNRFIANVKLRDGSLETVHVKNTGRCKELLLPGVEVALQDAYVDFDISDISDSPDSLQDIDIISNYNPERKTRYDLIAVKKAKMGWINIDSQVPNKLVNRWLRQENEIFKNTSFIKPEYKFGDSRVDFYIENEGRPTLIEVKGCTLEIDKKGYFPDAPTKRGAKHLNELSGAVQKGYDCYIAYVIAMNGINTVYPNEAIDTEYASTFNKALQSGVKVLYLCCSVNYDEIEITEIVKRKKQ